jgi:hypothetical protein
MKGRFRPLVATIALTVATFAAAADFGTPGGPPPGNVDAVADVLRQDPYGIELLISYGTSKGGSAGHLALAIRDELPGDDLVYSANFYADRAPEHARGFYTDDLMVRVPKKEYLYGTTSSLGETASFGLDFGETYKRSVIGVRVFGPSPGERKALVAFFARVNEDYRARSRSTDYHTGEVAYGYLDLNCAKTIGMGFKHGAGYADLEVKDAPLLSARRVKAAVTANIPTEMAMKLLQAWNARGYRMDVVLYRKYVGSTYVDPHDGDGVAFKDLPDRFPSVLSRDFRQEEGEYRDFDNLFAMYVLGNMGKYTVTLDAGTQLLEIRKSRSTMAYPQAAERAASNARTDSRKFRGGAPFRPSGNTLEDLARAP